jgi:hypothetical protein
MHVLYQTSVSCPVALSHMYTHHSFSESPGWKDFLCDMATKYEMHVYTMGTRTYAEEVCAAIDPDGKIFRGRILSRDESGSESYYVIFLNLAE